MAGIYDAFNHICEQYFSGSDNNVSDSIAEGLMRSVVENGRIAANDDQNYEARSNIMWAATWALNTLIAKGKPADWMVHMLRTGRGGRDRRDPRHDAFRREPSVLSLHHGCWVAEIRTFRDARVGINPVDKSERELAEAGFRQWKRGCVNWVLR